MFLTVQVEVREERSAALGETHWEVMGTIVTRARISSTSRVEVESFENILISLNVWGAIIDAVEVSQAACGVWKYGTAPPIYINYSGSWRWSYFRIAQIIGKWWARGKTGHFTSLSSLSGVPQLYLGWEQPCIFRQSHVTSTAVVSFDLIILMTWRSRCRDPDHTSTRRICFQVRDTTLLQWHQISIYPRLTGQVLLDVSWCFLDVFFLEYLWASWNHHECGMELYLKALRQSWRQAKSHSRKKAVRSAGQRTETLEKTPDVFPWKQGGF